MGMIVGSQSYIECDTCRAQSTKHYDQREARRIGESEGFVIWPTSGRALCRDCRSGKTKVTSESEAAAE